MAFIVVLLHSSAPTWSWAARWRFWQQRVEKPEGWLRQCCREQGVITTEPRGSLFCSTLFSAMHAILHVSLRQEKQSLSSVFLLQKLAVVLCWIFAFTHCHKSREIKNKSEQIKPNQWSVIYSSAQTLHCRYHIPCAVAWCATAVIDPFDHWAFPTTYFSFISSCCGINTG